MSFVKRVVFPLLVGIGLSPILGYAATTIHTVSGGAGIRLDDIGGAIASNPGGTHIVEFAGYSDLGNFTLSNVNADTLIFRRKSQSTAVIQFSKKILFSIDGFSGVVIFQGLAFKAAADSSWLMDGGGNSPVKNMVLDSCQILADKLTSQFMYWNGSQGSKIRFRKCSIAIKAGVGWFHLVSDSVLIDHNIINSAMLGEVHVQKILQLHNNTFVKGGIACEGEPLGSDHATASIKNNLFLFRPSLSRAYPLFVDVNGDINPDSIVNNAKDQNYSKWDDYNISNYTVGKGNVNFTIQSPDSTEFWNWNIPQDQTRGAYNPLGNPDIMSVYSLYPGNSAVRQKLGKDSVVVTLDSSEIPRNVDVTLGVLSYPPDIDSLRTVYLRDTTLKVSGPGLVTSIEMPRVKAFGSSELIGMDGSILTSQIRNTTPNIPVFQNSGSAKEFILAWGGQNTRKGTNVVPSNVPKGAILEFSSIDLAGNTVFFNSTSPSPTDVEIKVLQRNLKPVSLAESTTAIGAGTILFGVSDSLDVPPGNSDSVYFWISGLGLAKASKSKNTFIVSVPFGSRIEATLVERISSVSIVDQFKSMPHSFSLSQNFPNPFMGSTQIQYSLPSVNGSVLKGKFEVIDKEGRIVFSEIINPGQLDTNLVIPAQKWKPGVYVYQLTLTTSEKNFRIVKRMVLAK